MGQASSDKRVAMTITLVPLDLYSLVFQVVILIMAALLLSQLVLVQSAHASSASVMRFSGPLLLVFIIVYLGLRPLSGVFVDMTVYARMFERAKAGFAPDPTMDPGFRWLVDATSPWLGTTAFFLLCAVLYVVPLMLASKAWFGPRAYVGLLMLVSSFSFWAYGANGIRNGIAGSLFILGLSRNRRLQQAVLVTLAVLFHFSMILPALGLLAAYLVRNYRIFLTLWAISIPTSLLAGPLIKSTVAEWAITGERGAYLLAAADPTVFRYVGFRWDFLAVSAVGVLAGWYFLEHRRVTDPVYVRIYSVFLFSNAAWILVIDAPYSNRFAYLSWFLEGVVIIYPLLRQRLFVRQGTVVGLVVVASATFSFVLGTLL